MRKYFVLVITGDEDVLYQDELLSIEKHYFKTWDSDKILNVLDKYKEVKPISEHKHSHYKDFLNQRRRMTEFIKKHKTEPEHVYGAYETFGGNRSFSIEAKWCPEDSDFE